MSKATICCLRIRRWLSKKSWPSAGVDLLVIWVLAWWRERVVWCTIWCARSSKTKDWLMVSCGIVLEGRTHHTFTSRYILLSSQIAFRNVGYQLLISV